MLHDTEVCASLPVATWSVHVHRCEAHQAWEIGGYGWQQSGSERGRALWTPATVSLGPFDTNEDLRAQLQIYTRRMYAHVVTHT